MAKNFRKKKQKRCICNTVSLLKEITGEPSPLKCKEINEIRLNLFTERNSDGTGYLILNGKDLFDRYGRRINDLDIRAICVYVRELPRRIIKLDLSYNNITDKGFFKLLKKLLVKGRSSLINVNIMNNDLTDDTLVNLAKYASYLKLKYLRLNGNAFGVNCGHYIAKFLAINKSVEFIDLGECSLTLTSVAYIITALRSDHGKNTTLKVFDFSRIVPLFNRYSYETKWLAYHIEYLLERNTTIIELHLQKNEFIGHDMKYLTRGLRNNKTLLYLDLGFNKIGDYGVELIARYLTENPELILLNLAGNSIKDNGARALSFGLPFSKIRALDLSNNKMTDRGVLDILNSLKKSFFMRFLNIFGNQIGHVSSCVIKRMLESEVLFQHTIDVKLYEVDEVLYAAYYPNPADRNKHKYYCEQDFGYAQPMYHIKRNSIEEKRRVKVDCKQRHKLDKTAWNKF